MRDRRAAEHETSTSEARYRALFEASPVPTWEEDFSAVKAELDRLRAAGVEDFARWFEDHPEAVPSLASLIRIVEVNRESLRFFGVPSKEEIPGNLATCFSEASWPALRQEFIALADGKTHLELEVPILDLAGKARTVSLRLAVCPGFESTLASVLVTFIDITARKQAERAMQWSESNLRSLFDAVSESVFVVDPGGTVLAANATFAARLGKRPEDCIGACVYDLIPADLAASRRPWIEEVVRTGGPLVRDDERGGRWLQHTFQPVLNAAGAVDRIAVFALDTTRRRHHESVMAARVKLLQLAASRSLPELLRATLDEAEALTKSTIGFFHFVAPDQKTITLQVWSTNTVQNLCTAEGHGLHYPIAQAGVWVDCIRERRAVVHNDYASLPHQKGMPPGHAPVVRELVVPVMRGDKITAVLGVGNKADDYCDDDVALVEALADLAWDIAEAKRSDDALRASERRLQDIIGAMADWVWEVDAEGRYTFASESVSRLLGYEAGEIMGKTPFDLMPPSEAGRIGKVFADIVARKARFSDLENISVHRDGTLRYLLTSGVPLLGEDGTLLGYRGIDKDNTARRKLEERLLHAQKMEAVGQLAGGVAHDFNNILAAMMMHLGLLESDDTLTPDVRESVADLEREAERAASLTRQLLLFSRRQVMQVKVVDVDGIVDHLMKMLRRLLGEQIELQYRGSTTPMWIEADTGMMEQVVTNLCVNARDAMPDGGRLTLVTKRVSIDDSSSPRSPEAYAGAFARLSVEDTGEGMDETTLERVFEPFFTTKEVGKGTGLGLATVFGIVKQHRGWIDVESKLGSGSKFHVYLPLCQRAAGETIRPPGEAEVAGGGETILLVEDETALREGTAAYLRRLGYVVVEAAHGEAALRLWKERRGEIDLVLTDLVMPQGVSGLDLVEQLRKDKPALRFVMTSGYSVDLGKALERAGEGVTYLPKPSRPDLIARVIRTALDGV